MTPSSRIFRAVFRGLVSPQYQIEMSRRLRATANLQLVKLAQLAATAEGKPADTIDQLIAAEVLPPGFGRNTDGSGPIVERDRVIDSLRGEQGSFTPIPDVELRGVTASEAERYSARALYYQENWRQMDPLMVGMKRYALGEGNIERLVIDANISPLAEEKYGWLMSMIGPPTDVRIVTPAGRADLDAGFVARHPVRSERCSASLVPGRARRVARCEPPANRLPRDCGHVAKYARVLRGVAEAWGA